MTAGALLLATRVSAQEGVLVIDLEREEADAALATHLGAAMREAASQVPGWRVEAQDPSLRDAMTAASCTSLDEACLGRIALAQQAERVIWGRILTLPPTPTVESANEAGGSPLPPPVEQRLVELRVFRAGWQTIELTMSDRVPAAAASAAVVMPRVRTWIERI